MKEVFEYILSLFKSRIFPLILVFAILVGVLINRLFGLQIINGESYVKDLSSSIQRCGDKRKNIRQEWCASCL